MQNHKKLQSVYYVTETLPYLRPKTFDLRPKTFDLIPNEKRQSEANIGLLQHPRWSAL